jgi:glycosyltransferase involved in cell wall biosynthesis
MSALVSPRFNQYIYPMDFNFPNVSLLITHYNRSRSLERLLSRFEKLNCSFGNIVVSDDASDAIHMDKILALKSRFDLQLVCTDQNKGLGNNINKGQEIIRTAYTLYVQEDFVPLPLFPEKLVVALEYLAKMKDIDMVRFYSYRKYPYLKPLANGFSVMQFSPFSRGYEKFYYYSDHPHLRRTGFLEKYGRYEEGIRSDVTEYRMMLTFLRKKGKALYYDEYNSLFEQVNSPDEPSSVNRIGLRQTNNFLIRNIRHLYRFIKFHFNYFRP